MLLDPLVAAFSTFFSFFVCDLGNAFGSLGSSFFHLFLLFRCLLFRCVRFVLFSRRLRCLLFRCVRFVLFSRRLEKPTTDFTTPSLNQCSLLFHSTDEPRF